MEGDNVTLVCSSVGGPNNTYQWQANNSNITGETSQVLTLPHLEASDGGIYTCIVSNLAGSDNASTFVYVSPYIITQPLDMSATYGSSVMLLCEADGFPSPEVKWGRTDQDSIRDNINISSSTLFISFVLFGDEGEYYCEVSSLNITLRSAATLTGNVLL